MEGEGANGQGARGAIPRLPGAYAVAGCDENATPLAILDQYTIDALREGRSKLGGQKR